MLNRRDILYIIDNAQERKTRACLFTYYVSVDFGPEIRAFRAKLSFNQEHTLSDEELVEFIQVIEEQRYKALGDNKLFYRFRHLNDLLDLLASEHKLALDHLYIYRDRIPFDSVTILALAKSSQPMHLFTALKGLGDTNLRHQVKHKTPVVGFEQMFKQIRDDKQPRERFISFFPKYTMDDLKQCENELRGIPSSPAVQATMV